MKQQPPSANRVFIADDQPEVLDLLADKLRSRGKVVEAFPSGARLTERELTEQMGVSRTVLREALRQLEAEHLIEVIPNKGPVVRALSREEAEDLYRIRAVLHGLAARICVENADVGDIGHLQVALATVVYAYDSGDAEHVLDAKTVFYDVLYSGTRSESLSAMLDTLQARIARWRALGLGHPEQTPMQRSG